METYLPDSLRQNLMPRRAAASARVGVFGIGLAAYWPQFAGLKERLESFQQYVEATLGGFGAHVAFGGACG